MKNWYWWLLGLITYVVFLIAYIPATMLASYVQEQSKNEISFASVSGTLFSGSAASIGASGINVNNVDWRLSPLSLITGTAKLDIKGGNIRQSEQIYVNGLASVSLFDPMNFSVRDLQLFVPTKTVLSQIKLPVYVTASGRFRLDIDELVYEQGCVELTGSGQWLKASVGVQNKDISLGVFDADLTCQSPNFAIALSSDQVLQIDANLSISPTGDYNVNGQFLPASNLPKQIQQAAGFFGQPNEQGFYTIEL